MQSISTVIDTILREEIAQAQKDSPALIVRSAFEIIEGFLNQGLSLERIAAALQKHDIQINKGHLVRHLGMIREERGLLPLKRGRKPKQSMASSPTNRNPADALRIGMRPSSIPEEITSLKFIEVKGELLDVTKMNIDDYLTVSKTIPDNAKIPEGMFDTIAAENRIRGMYERALSQYDEAIARWKSSQ